jgi:hypothetical protein
VGERDICKRERGREEERHVDAIDKGGGGEGREGEICRDRGGGYDMDTKGGAERGGGGRERNIRENWVRERETWRYGERGKEER